MEFKTSFSFKYRFCWLFLLKAEKCHTVKHTLKIPKRILQEYKASNYIGSL